MYEQVETPISVRSSYVQRSKTPDNYAYPSARSSIIGPMPAASDIDQGNRWVSLRQQYFSKKNSPILEAVYSARSGRSYSPSRFKDEDKPKWNAFNSKPGTPNDNKTKWSFLNMKT